ncbi:MAG: hypothetical protein LBS52_05750 [Dysgonamonadaceae bacterium]|jgi:hypothetical protein|nr:hypothetical protein [Dysgonamonadaceae bacterium]
MDTALKNKHYQQPEIEVFEGAPSINTTVSTFNNDCTTEQYFDEIKDWLNEYYKTNYELK